MNFMIIFCKKTFNISDNCRISLRILGNLVFFMLDAGIFAIFLWKCLNLCVFSSIITDVSNPWCFGWINVNRSSSFGSYRCRWPLSAQGVNTLIELKKEKTEESRSRAGSLSGPLCYRTSCALYCRPLSCVLGVDARKITLYSPWIWRTVR